MTAAVRFVRRTDGLSYEFVRDGQADSYPCYRRLDADLWCRRLPDFGWVVCDETAAVSGRPFGDAGWGDLPPEGVWVSYRGDRSYVYDLAHVDGHRAPSHESG